MSAPDDHVHAGNGHPAEGNEAADGTPGAGDTDSRSDAVPPSVPPAPQHEDEGQEKGAPARTEAILAQTDASPGATPPYAPIPSSPQQHDDTGPESENVETSTVSRVRRLGWPSQPYGALPGEPEVVEVMIALRRQGLGYRSIAFELNARQLPSRHGRNWHAATVRATLTRFVPELCPRMKDLPAVPQRHVPGHVRDLARRRENLRSRTQT